MAVVEYLEGKGEAERALIWEALRREVRVYADLAMVRTNKSSKCGRLDTSSLTREDTGLGFPPPGACFPGTSNPRSVTRQHPAMFKNCNVLDVDARMLDTPRSVRWTLPDKSSVTSHD